MNEKGFEYWMVSLSDLTEKYLPKLAMAVITLVIGLWIISRLTKLYHILLRKKNVEVSLISFLIGLYDRGLKVSLIISVATMVGPLLVLLPYLEQQA